MTAVADRVRGYRVFMGLPNHHAASVAECARPVAFPNGAALLREGEDAQTFYLIRRGRVALQTSSPHRPPTTFQTACDGDFVGVSWLVPPYRWSFDARAVTDVQALAFDARCLRDKCDADHDLGYALMQRFVPALVERLHNARRQALDLYGSRA